MNSLVTGEQIGHYGYGWMVLVIEECFGHTWSWVNGLVMDHWFGHDFDEQYKLASAHFSELFPWVPVSD